MKRQKALPSMIVVFAVVGTLCIAFAAEGTGWKPYAETAFFTFHYDADDIRYPSKRLDLNRVKVVKGYILGVWTKRVPRGEEGRERQIEEYKKSGLSTKGYERYAHTVAMEEINCREKTFRVISETDFDKEGNKLGAFVQEPSRVRWKPILPESDHDALFTVLCKELPSKMVEVQEK